MSYARRKVLHALLRRGFVVLREGGRHTILRDREGRQIAVPRHDELKRGTVRSIAEDAEVDWDQFKGEIS